MKEKKNISSHQTLYKLCHPQKSSTGMLLFTHANTTGRSMCVCVWVHARTLCSRGARVYVMSRDEITVDWLSHTVHSVPLWTHTHTHVAVGPASTHIIKDTHTYTPTLFPADWLSSCLSDVFFFFFYLNNITSWACVWLVCTCVCVRICVCLEVVHLSVCACVCVLSLGKCFGGSYIFTTLQGFSKNWDTASSCSCVCLKCQRERERPGERGTEMKKEVFDKEIKTSEKTIRGWFYCIIKNKTYCIL